MSFPVQQLRKFVSLSPAERRLLADAALWVAFVRLGLWFLSFQSLRRLLARLAHRRKSSRGGRRIAFGFKYARDDLRSGVSVHSPQLTPERITWAVRASSRFVPQATCLTQALAAQVLLQREGYPAHLRLGVALEKSKLQSHAWVESQGKIVIGGPRFEHLTSLPSFDQLAI